MTLLSILLATFIVSFISFVGAFALIFSKNMLDKILSILVALAGGGLMGGAFLHLIPESLFEIGSDELSILWIFIPVSVICKGCKSSECFVALIFRMCKVLLLCVPIPM